MWVYITAPIGAFVVILGELVTWMNFDDEESSDEDFYVNVLSNRTLYREYKLSKGRLPYLRRALKREPDAGHVVELEKMLSYVEKYNNLESFEFDYGF